MSAAAGRRKFAFSHKRRGPGAVAFTAILAVSAVLLAACGSSGSKSSSGNVASSSLGTTIFGSIPPVGTPVKGGTITLGQLSGQTPTYIFPIVPGAQTSTGTISFLSQLFMPLYSGPTGARPQVDYAMSAGQPLQFSDGDKTVTIPIRPGLKWSNGDPLDASDVVFWFDLLKAAIKESPANWGQYTPGLMPDNVTSISTSGNNVVMHLTKAFNPGFFLNNNLQDTNNVFPLPSRAWNIASAGGPHLDFTNPANAKKIYDYLNKAGGSVASFASNPLWKVVSGPFELKSFSATNSSYVLAPNPSYGGSPKSMVDQLQVNTYTGFTAELNAMKSGSLDIATVLDPSQIAEMPVLKQQGIDIFGGPSWGWFAPIFNFKNTTNHFDKVIGQLYVRQAFARLFNQTAIIKGVFKGAAVPAYGPTPSAPVSPYAPASATINPYPYDPAAAVSLLKSHGWDVKPGGVTTCAKPGTAANECGAGIPAGTPIKFVWANQPQSAATTGVLESEAFASEAKAAAGIDVVLQTKTFNFLISNYNDANPAAAKYTNDWGVNNYGGLFTDYYPTASGVWNEGAGFNTGGYNDPMANTLIDASVHSGDPNAVKTEAQYEATHLPVLFGPDQDNLMAANFKHVGGPPDGWTAMTQQQYFPNYWYRVK
jgi:peptide/nickel transport system substrate-binding protein